MITQNCTHSQNISVPEHVKKFLTTFSLGALAILLLGALCSGALVVLYISHDGDDDINNPYS